MIKQLPYYELIDLPEWRGVSSSPSADVAGGNLSQDYRKGINADPCIYHVNGTGTLIKYNTITDAWLNLQSPQLLGFGAGASSVFVPSAGPRSTLLAGCTSTVLNLAGGFTAYIGKNQLGNRGNDIGFLIRVIDNGAGGTGKTEQRHITYNTAGLTPTVTLDVPLSFTPVTGSNFEIHSGRLYILGTSYSQASTTQSTTAGSASITSGSFLAGNGFKTGIGISGTGITPGTYIQAINAAADISSGTWARTAGSTTITVTLSNHGFISNQKVQVTVTSDGTTFATGYYIVTVTASGTFTFTGNNAGGTTGTLSIAAGTITMSQVANQTGTNALTYGFVQSTPNGTTSTGLPYCSYTTGQTITPGTLIACAINGVFQADGVVFAANTRVLKVINNTVFTTSNNALTTNGGTVTFFFYGGNFNQYSPVSNEVSYLSSPMMFATGISSIGTDGELLSLSEKHVPHNITEGDGFFGNITASASAAGTITSTASGAGTDAVANILINEYRNFQIRIVQDTGAPTAAGQRRRIASHTAGVSGVTSPVYTLYTNWSVTPSSNAIFVIENDDDKIIYFSGNTAYPLNYSISADTWDMTTWAPRSTMQTLSITLNASASNFLDLASGNTSALSPGMVLYGPSITAGTKITDITSATRITVDTSTTVGASPITLYAYAIPGAGLMNVQPFGLARNAVDVGDHSGIISFRGLNTPIVDYFDIAGAAAGAWTLNIAMNGLGQMNMATTTAFVGELFTTGSCIVYAPGTHEGRFAYINVNGTVRMAKLDLVNTSLHPFQQLRFSVGTTVVGSRLSYQSSPSPEDPTLEYVYLYCLMPSSQVMHNILLR